MAAIEEADIRRRICPSSIPNLNTCNDMGLLVRGLGSNIVFWSIFLVRHISSVGIMTAVTCLTVIIVRSNGYVVRDIVNGYIRSCFRSINFLSKNYSDGAAILAKEGLGSHVKIISALSISVGLRMYLGTNGFGQDMHKDILSVNFVQNILNSIS